MARAQQTPWVANAVITEANWSRSRHHQLVGAGYSAGTLIAAIGNAALNPGEVRYVLVAPTPQPTPSIAPLMARDCELNDAYINYGGLNRAQVNTTLAQYNIIVRPGVLADSLVGALGDPDTPEGAQLAATVPVPVEGGGGPVANLALRSWAAVLYLRSFVIGIMIRWGRRPR